MGILVRVELDRVLASVGHRIRELREERCITQTALAERLHSQVNNYQRIERGEQNVTMRTLVGIANALGVPIAEFFSAPTTTRAGPGRPRRR